MYFHHLFTKHYKMLSTFLCWEIHLGQKVWVSPDKPLVEKHWSRRRPDGLQSSVARPKDTRDSGDSETTGRVQINPLSMLKTLRQPTTFSVSRSCQPSDETEASFKGQRPGSKVTLMTRCVNKSRSGSGCRCWMWHSSKVARFRVLRAAGRPRGQLVDDPSELQAARGGTQHAHL